MALDQDGYQPAHTSADVDLFAHNPKVAGSNPAPPPFGKALVDRKIRQGLHGFQDPTSHALNSGRVPELDTPFVGPGPVGRSQPGHRAPQTEGSDLSL